MVSDVSDDELDDEQFLMGGGGTSAKFDVGTVVRGKVLSKRMAQQTDFKTKKPLYWDDGRKRMQLVVQLQTDERDDEIEDDDGVRNVYVKFKMRDAIKDAVKKAGAKRIDVGGELAIKCTGQEKPKVRGEQGTKLYRAKYTAPDPAEYSGEDEFLDGDEPTEEEPPPPPKKAPAKKAAAAKKASAKKAAAAAVDEFSDDDDAGDDDDGF